MSIYNTHPQILELERAVLLYPEDIDRRLIYADALEEFHVPYKYPGLERAEFIRTQIALDKLGPPRKVYGEHHVDTFYTRRGWGSCYVEGIPEPLEVGERIDLHLTLEEANSEHPNTVNEIPRPQRVKQYWPGVLVTEYWKTQGNQWRYHIGFKIDELSRPHPGNLLGERLRELFRLGDARGDLPLPNGAVQGGLHTTPRTTLPSTEIWPSQPGGQMPAILPRWRFVWRNGFIDYVACRADDWRTYGPFIVKHAPIREVEPIGVADFDYKVNWARQEAGLDVKCKDCIPTRPGLVWAERKADEDEYACATCGGAAGRQGHYPKPCPTKFCPSCKGTGWVVNDS